MIQQNYREKKAFLWTGNLCLICIGTYLVWRISQNLSATIITAVFLLMAFGLTLLQYRLDDQYISSVVNDLSMLCDNLLTLEERQIFPANEDNMLSKLQNKILKLVSILKHNNQASLAEQENIKSLVSDISHQLKTPIANLKMYTEFLSDDTISEKQRREYIEIVRISVDRLIFLSESMIKISRLEGGMIHLHTESQSLNETVLCAVKNVFAKAKRSGIELTYDGEEITTCHDRRWTTEAIFNLLDNAVKYTPSGGKIAIQVKRLGMFSSIAISDMADVITEKERTKIFQRFYRGKNIRHTEGIGVGLYLAREIVVKQGGYINLSSQKSGNCFTIYLPTTFSAMEAKQT